MTISFETGVQTGRGDIPLCVPEIRGNEWKYIKECLDTGWVSSGGSFVDRFERELSVYTGAKYAVATVNGTAALHIALLVAGIQPDDEVLIPTLTFIAPANAIRYVGAWPVFIDVEPKYWQIDPDRTLDFLKQKCRWNNGELRNKKTGRRVGAILPVHLLGHPFDMDPILEIARKFDLPVIEDASESLGSRYKDRIVGSIGDIACFSFNGNKIISTGGGGMIVTNDPGWARRARYLCTQAKDDPLEHIHDEIGYNYRLTSIQAAMGCAQMERVDDYISAKRRIASTYGEALSAVPGITCMKEASWVSSTFWMYTILVDETGYGKSSRSLLRQLQLHDIQSRPLWQPLHLSRAHRGAYTSNCLVAERIFKESLSLPCSVGLRPSDQNRVIEIVTSFSK